MGLNLLRNRLKIKGGNAYVIHCVRRNDDWYFVGIDDDFNKVMWSAHIDKAQVFTTEEGVNEFKQIYLSERECGIVRIE